MVRMLPPATVSCLFFVSQVNKDDSIQYINLKQDIYLVSLPNLLPPFVLLSEPCLQNYNLEQQLSVHTLKYRPPTFSVPNAGKHWPAGAKGRSLPRCVSLSFSWQYLQNPFVLFPSPLYTRLLLFTTLMSSGFIVMCTSFSSLQKNMISSKAASFVSHSAHSMLQQCYHTSVKLTQLEHFLTRKITHAGLVKIYVLVPVRSKHQST